MKTKSVASLLFWAFVLIGSVLSAKEKVIFDTDIGGDVDDLIALTYLLAQPDCNLLGVTVVASSPSVNLKCEIASAACKAVGRDDVPIHPGLRFPMLNGKWFCPLGKEGSIPHYWPIVKGRAHETFGRENTAIEFMRRTIRANPGEVTLVATGHFTNLGVLFASDPEIPGLLKRLVLMGGNMKGHLEWNAGCDAVATAIAFLNGHQSRPPETIVLSSDVTAPHHLSVEEGRRYLSAKGFELCAEGAEHWYRTCKGLYFHDPMAAVAIFKPEIATYTNVTVSVDVAKGGITAIDAKPNPDFGLLKVATSINARAFDDELTNVVIRAQRCPRNVTRF